MGHKYRNKYLICVSNLSFPSFGEPPPCFDIHIYIINHFLNGYTINFTSTSYNTYNGENIIRVDIVMSALSHR